MRIEKGEPLVIHNSFVLEQDIQSALHSPQDEQQTTTTTHVQSPREDP